MSDDIETDGQGMAVVETAFLALREVGLRLPPIPRELMDSLARQGEAIFNTGPLQLGDLPGILAAAEDTAAPTQLGFGHIGHGVNSWQFCFQLVTRSLALFLRLPHGGIYTSDEDSVAQVNHALFLAEELIVAADTAAPAGTKRVLVVRDIPGNNLCRLPEDTASVKVGDAMTEALARLRTGHRSAEDEPSG